MLVKTGNRVTLPHHPGECEKSCANLKITSLPKKNVCSIGHEERINCFARVLFGTLNSHTPSTRIFQVITIIQIYPIYDFAEGMEVVIIFPSPFVTIQTAKENDIDPNILTYGTGAIFPRSIF